MLNLEFICTGFSTDSRSVRKFPINCKQIQVAVFACEKKKFQNNNLFPK